MKDDKKVPQLRFPEFTDAWKQRELKEVVNFSRGQGLPWADVDDLNGQFECILYGNLYTDYGTIIQNIKHKTNTDLKVKSKGNEVLIPGSDTTPTGLARALFLEKENVILGGDINILSVKHDDGPFLAYELNKLKKELIIRIKGTTVKHLQNNDLKDIVVSLPSLEEQRKISSLFSRLDNTITLQQRKLNSLQKLKKGLLQKMFPKNGENIPEIRFPEFSDAWKQRKVGDLLVERREMVTEDNEYPLMAFIANEGVAPKGDRFDRSALVKNADSKKYKRTKYGDFIYSSNNLESGSIGLNKYGKASISPVYSIFYPTNLADSDFIGRYFLRKDFIGQMIRWRQGVVYGQWKIPEADFLNIDIYIPSKDEQEKIGQILDKVDNTITLQQRKLESLQKLKKGLLQQMFI